MGIGEPTDAQLDFRDSDEDEQGPLSHPRELLPRVLGDSDANPQIRREAARGVIEAAGGKLFSFDFAPGTKEVVVVVDFPSDAYGAAAAIATTSAGVLRTYTVTRLMSPEETIEVVEQASAITYPPPT